MAYVRAEGCWEIQGYVERAGWKRVVANTFTKWQDAVDYMKMLAPNGGITEYRVWDVSQEKALQETT